MRAARSSAIRQTCRLSPNHTGRLSSQATTHFLCIRGAGRRDHLCLTQGSIPTGPKSHSQGAAPAYQKYLELTIKQQWTYPNLHQSQRFIPPYSRQGRPETPDPEFCAWFDRRRRLIRFALVNTQNYYQLEKGTLRTK
jgi:hypothetical protein